MKRFTILFALILSSGIISFGQDWQPVKRNMQSYFANAYSIIDSIIVNSLYADSMEIDALSGDSVFYLNRLTLDCDSCGSAVKITGLPHFLNSKMIKYNNGVYEFKDPGQIVLYVNKPIGFTWIYDSINDLSAEITNKTQQNLFGINDSVMNINLQDWGVIEISKHFGIVYYGLELPDIFFLVGTDHPEMGKEVINYNEIFNFQPGDINQYENIIYGYDPSTGTHSFHSIHKEKILSKTIGDNFLVYFVKTLVMNWEENYLGIPSDTSFSQSYDTVSYSSEPWLAYNCIPGSACQLEELWFTDEIIYSIPKDTTDEEGNRIKMFGPGLNQTGTNFYLYEEETNYLYDYYLTGDYTFTENLGNEYYTWIVELGEERYLQGYVRNGDTSGYIIPDEDFLVDIEENKPSPDNSFSIYPNPANDHFYLRINDEKIQEIEIRILDLNGKIRMNKKLQFSGNPIQFYIADIPSGLYFINVIFPTNSLCRKIIIR